MRIWSTYLDKNISRKDGRRVSKKLAFDDPKIDDIYKAARVLHLRPEVEDKKYPRFWWQNNNCIKIEDKWTKLETLRRISNIMHKESESS